MLKADLRMSLSDDEQELLEFNELESRFGRENAFAILRALEQFEGVSTANVLAMPYDQRLQNVFQMMRENSAGQTRH